MQAQKWLMQINTMCDAEEIDEDDARQLSYDLNSTYAKLTMYLKSESWLNKN